MDMDVISGVNRTTESASPDVTRVDAGKAVAVQKTTAAPSNVTDRQQGRQVDRSLMQSRECHLMGRILLRVQ